MKRQARSPLAQSAVQPRRTASEKPWKETDPMVLLTLRRTDRYLSAVFLAAFFAALLLLTGARASAAQGHHKRGPHSTHRRGARHHATRADKNKPPGAAKGLGQLTGLLPRDHLTEESAIQVDLSHETVRLPLYPGTAPVPGEPSKTEKVWFVLLDASDQGLAHDLGVNFAPKLANIAIGDPAAVQTVTLDSPSPEQNRFGPAVVHFQGAPDFSSTRIAEPGPSGFPLKKFQPGSVAGPSYSPFIKIA